MALSGCTPGPRGAASWLVNEAEEDRATFGGTTTLGQAGDHPELCQRASLASHGGQVCKFPSMTDCD